MPFTMKQIFELPEQIKSILQDYDMKDGKPIWWSMSGTNRMGGKACRQLLSMEDPHKLDT